MKIIIALGGNALTKKGERESYKNLLKNVKKTSSNLVKLIKNNKIVIVPGNGPAVGFLLLQNEIARGKAPEMPLDVLGAETEGQIGYLLQEQLTNEMHKNEIHKNVVTLITQTLVSKKDEAFNNPTKFVGTFYTKKQAEKLKNKFVIKKDSNRGYRRVVPSPKPLKVLESNLINKLADSGNIIIAAGGGGIPVVLDKKEIKGVEAVIDKDLASSILGKEIKADLLLILTNVKKVFLNYGTKKQKALTNLKLVNARKYLNEGYFPAGSMGPKIEASINFLKSGGKKVIITNIVNIDKSLKGKAGTTITK